MFAAVLFVPTLYELLRAHGGQLVRARHLLVALVLWFVALTAAYRFRLLDRVLGLDTLP